MFQSPKSHMIFSSFVYAIEVMARALRIAERKINGLEEKVKQDAPLVLFANSVSASKNSILVGELARLL